MPVVPGALVMNLGEMLQSITGNYFVATPHRVVTAAARQSVGYFHGPALDTPLVPIALLTLAALACLLPALRAARVDPITAMRAD